MGARAAWLLLSVPLSFTYASFSILPSGSEMIQCDPITMSWTEQPPIHLWAVPDREVEPGDPVLVDFGNISTSSFQWNVQLQVGQNVSFTYVQLSNPLLVLSSADEYVVQEGTSTACLSGGSSAPSSVATNSVPTSGSTAELTAASEMPSLSQVASSILVSSATLVSTAESTIPSEPSSLPQGTSSTLVPSATSASTASLNIPSGLSSLSQAASNTLVFSATSSPPYTSGLSTVAKTKRGISNAGKIAIGIVAGLILCVALTALIIWRRKSRNKRNSNQLDDTIAETAQHQRGRELITPFTLDSERHTLVGTLGPVTSNAGEPASNSLLTQNGSETENSPLVDVSIAERAVSITSDYDSKDAPPPYVTTLSDIHGSVTSNGIGSRI